MAMWPEYETRDDVERLLVGTAPRVRRGNRVGLGVALAIFVPTVLAVPLVGAESPHPMVLAAIAASAAAGLWSFGLALTGRYVLEESRDVVFDKARDRVTRKGRLVCALSAVSAVAVRAYSTPSEYARADELILTYSRARPGGSALEEVVLLDGSGLWGPAEQIRTFLGVSDHPGAPLASFSEGDR